MFVPPLQWMFVLAADAGAAYDRRARRGSQHPCRTFRDTHEATPMTIRRSLIRSALLSAILLLGAATLPAQERRVINPPGLPTNLPFSNGIQVGDMLWIAGTEGIVSGDITEETRTALANVKKVLDAAGFDVRDVVQVTVYLKDVDEFQKMNAVYREFFPDPRPTRTTVQVARLVNDARVEITSVAVRRRPARRAR
jgi:2-iminobutanoate/2-iminopropanoate deaminase